jgi:hypothetical protein
VRPDGASPSGQWLQEDRALLTRRLAPGIRRFLRARKWVPQDAYVQFSETEKFRNANEIEKLYDTIDIDSYESSRKLYPRFTGRRDKR